MTNLTTRPEWQALARHHQSIAEVTLKQHFAEDSRRFDAFQLSAAGVFLDYSKNHITQQTLDALFALARSCQLPERINDLFSGEKINTTEGRAALHTALRNRSGLPVYENGNDVMPDILAVLERMREFSDKVRAGDWKGRTGQAITDVVNIGIGGSDLGPLMATEALKPFCHQSLSFHFVSNVDGAHLGSTLKTLNPDTTLFIVASKTFTTIETLTNAHSARQWFIDSGAAEADVAKHFVALSTNAEKVSEFGIDTGNMFGFWDWVGGRYSLWSAIGLPIVLAIGMDRFEQLLQGAHDMDEHFKSAPMSQNMPVILGMLSVWYLNFFGVKSHLVAPYDQHLHRFPAYLQQLVMESNGKSVYTDGSPVEQDTSAVVWGEPGTNGQHAFFQLLHQGTHLIPTDFIVPIESLYAMGEHHKLLLANCIAQAESLMTGRDAQTVADDMTAAGLTDSEVERLTGHRTFSGNRPSNMLMVQQVSPGALGALIALYEHKVFVEATIWGINPFDQWGVELGKKLASSVYEEIHAGARVDSHDSSTNGLINRVLKLSQLHA
ncbi:MAG: glucose-6-phosphate isomerase [Gammaproteobacteria bacterium]|nr:glucose-6-phosphate isomerase [Gammaproteobacteria bacterium]